MFISMEFDAAQIDEILNALWVCANEGQTKDERVADELHQRLSSAAKRLEMEGGS